MERTYKFYEASDILLCEDEVHVRDQTCSSYGIAHKGDEDGCLEGSNDNKLGENDKVPEQKLKKIGLLLWGHEQVALEVSYDKS